MTQVRGLDSHSAKASARVSAQPFEPFSDADRELLQWHLTAAARAVFPASERIGKTAQQDFYFRELLERLLLNFESQAPITGGNHVEIWAFVRSSAPKWRARPGSKKRRSGYDRKSIKTLVHEWRRAVASRTRSYRKRGVIEFVLQTPDENCDDVVLFATITDFPLVDGELFSVDITELTDETRLPAPSLDEDSDSKPERERLLSRASRIVRDVERKYLEKLQEAPLEFIAAEVETLERDKRRRDYRRLAAAIVVILGAGMAAYKILSVHRFVPVFDVSKGGRQAVANVISDHKGHLALAEDGRAVSPWANAIFDEGGNGVLPHPAKSGSVLLLAHDVIFMAKIPERWKDDDPTILPPEGTCFTMKDGGVGIGVDIGCNVLYDLRSVAPQLNGDDDTLAGDFGEQPRTFTTYKPDEVTCTNSNCSRIRIWMLHRYKRDGRYPIHLVIFEDPKGGWLNGAPIDGTPVHGVPLVKIAIKNRRLASVEPLAGANFVAVDPLPDDLKLHPKSKSTTH